MARRGLNKRKFILRLLTIVLIIYISYQMVQNLLNPYETYSLSYGEVNVVSNYTSYIIRNETLITSENGGEIKYFVTEGERVKRGHKIAEIVVLDTPVTKMVNGVEEKLSEAEILSVSTESIEKEIVALRDEIIYHVNGQNLLKVSGLKEELALKIEKRDRLFENSGVQSFKFQPFTQKSIGSSNVKTGQTLVVRSLDSGIVTFTRDGYEDILNLEKLYDIDYFQLAEKRIDVKDLKTNKIPPNTAVYKLVDNSTWYVVSIISQEEIKIYRQLMGKNITVDFNKEKIIGKVFDVFETGNQTGALVIKFKNQASGFYGERKKDLDITRENYRGLKVPKDAIIKGDEYEGVFVVGLENKVKFIPIKPILSNDEDVIVYESRFYDTVAGEVITVQTVDQHSIVVRNPNNVREGDTIY